MHQSFLHFLFFGKWAYLAKLVLGILLLIGLNLFLKKVLVKIRKKYLAKGGHWKEKIDYIFHLPLFVSSWIIGLSFCFNILKEHYNITDLPYLSMIRNSLLVACGSWMVLRWNHVLKRILIAKSRDTEISTGTIQTFGKICNFTVLLLSALLILQILGLNIVPLLAFGGIGAAALAIASKDVIANFFGGAMLTLTRPFVEGDMIVIPGKDELTGTVEEIGLYMTQIRDLEKRPVYLPNALFSTMMIVNMSRMTHRRILETVKIRLADIEKVKDIIDAIKSNITNHPRVDTHLPVHVVLKEFGNYSLDLHIEGCTLATRLEEFLKVKQEIFLSIHDVLKAHQAELAVPMGHLQLHTAPAYPLSSLIPK